MCLCLIVNENGTCRRRDALMSAFKVKGADFLPPPVATLAVIKLSCAGLETGL